jgi:putative flippase GtrA
MESPLLSKPQPTRGEQRAARTTPAAPATPAEAAPTAPGPLASFVRFVVCGGGVGILSSAAVPLVAALMPWALANALITVASTILCTELHALFTFGTGGRAGWRRHLQSAGSATAAYVVTCAAMFALHAVQSSPGLFWEQTVYLSAAGLAGIGRFLVLRLFVFAGGRDGGAAARPAVVRPSASRPRRPLLGTGPAAPAVASATC